MEATLEYAKPFEDHPAGWCIFERLHDGRRDLLDGPYRRREDAERSLTFKRSLAPS